MCKHQQQKRKNCIFENAGEPLILHSQRLGRLWPPHEIGCAAWSETQSCFFTALTEDFMQKILLEYLICFITWFRFLTMRMTDNLKLTGTMFDPLNVCVQNHHKDSFLFFYFFGHTVYSILLAPSDECFTFSVHLHVLSLCCESHWSITLLGKFTSS